MDVDVDVDGQSRCAISNIQVGKELDWIGRGNRGSSLGSAGKKSSK